MAREPQAGPSHRPEPEPVRQPPPPQRPAEPPSQILPPQEERSGQQQHVDLVSGSGPDLVSSSQSGVPDLVQSQNNVAQPDVVTGKDSGWVGYSSGLDMLVVRQVTTYFNFLPLLIHVSSFPYHSLFLHLVV